MSSALQDSPHINPSDRSQRLLPLSARLAARRSTVDSQQALCCPHFSPIQVCSRITLARPAFRFILNIPTFRSDALRTREEVYCREETRASGPAAKCGRCRIRRDGRAGFRWRRELGGYQLWQSGYQRSRVEGRAEEQCPDRAEAAEEAMEDWRRAVKCARGEK